MGGFRVWDECNSCWPRSTLDTGRGSVVSYTYTTTAGENRGYSTEFNGRVQIGPPLNPTEVAYLQKFAETRRMDRENGPYFVQGDDGPWGSGQGDGPDKIRDHNRPPAGQPGLWCKWTVTDDGRFIEWSGAEKFYSADEWMQYVLDHFLRPSAVASRSADPQFEQFTFDHVCNGTINAEGEESGDVWRLIVQDNEVRVSQAVLTWPDE